MTDPILRDIAIALDRFRPLHDFVLVERIPEPEEQRGIILPGVSVNKREGVRMGKVLACGPGDKCSTCFQLGSEDNPDRIKNQRKHAVDTGHHFSHGRFAMNVSVGDTIIYNREPANDVRINGREMVLIHEQQRILAVIE